MRNVFGQLTGKPGNGLIIDAVVLIDFLESDASLLQLITEHIGPLFLATTTLDEVEQLDEADCVALGLTLVEPTLEHLEEAIAIVGPLSLEDALTMILARDNGWLCMTNDKALRRKCEEYQVRNLWGLETVALLVESQAILSEDGQKIA
jgi:predicted nucleic acid-binding protein